LCYFHDDFTLGLVATMGKRQTRQQGSVCDSEPGDEAMVRLQAVPSRQVCPVR
jgi:hypothetical protein